MRLRKATLGLLLVAACDRDGQASSVQGAADVESAKAGSVAAGAVVPSPQPPSVGMPEVAPEPPDETAPDEETYVEPEPPQAPVAPADYGQIKPPEPLPTEDLLVNHALAGYEVVAVYSKPDRSSARLGYLRIGTRTKVAEKVSGPGCSKGWYALPQGGFACSGKKGGLVVDKKRAPYMYKPPPPPKLDEAMPYSYAYVRKFNTPMYWRIPSAAEQKEAATQRAVLEAKREGTTLPGEPSPTPASAGAPAEHKPAPKPELTASKPGDKPGSVLKDLPKPSAADGKSPTPAAGKKGQDKPKPAVADKGTKPTPATSDPAPAKSEVAAKPKTAAATSSAGKPVTKNAETAAGQPSAEPPPPIVLPLSRQNPWLEKGFYVSLAEKVREEGKSWWKTARGAYLPASAAGTVKNRASFEGVALTEETDFPFGYAMAKAPKLYELTDAGKLKLAKSIERRTFLDLSEETVIKGRAYMVTTEGLLIRKDHVRFADRQSLPDGIQPWERWVDVDISKQLLVGYEGDRPVYVTLVSTGRKGTEEEPFDTPTGTWRIRSKHVTTTMDGGTASDGNYSIQDVPWAMFFYQSYALHGAFWHNGFGRVRSHGCVNLSPADARWLFNWTTPFLPEGWHGVHAHEGSPGTTVVVRKSAKD